MRIERRLGIRSAYGQLVFIVFLPIAILAMVGGLLVFFETKRALQSEQDALAQSALIRYEPIIKPLLPNIQQNDRQLLDGVIQTLHTNHMNALLVPSAKHAPLSNQDIHEESLLYQVSPEQYVRRVAILDKDGVPIVSTGYGQQNGWREFNLNADSVWRLPTENGMAYGMPLEHTENGTSERFWLFIEMDNEPTVIAYYRIVLALAITGLTTILLLLLVLSIYSKRWITPVYEMRLFLQRIGTDTLDKTLTTRSDGEFRLLQQDLNQALKRLNISFSELKTYSEETENDLQLALDEMEMQNISIRKARDLAVHASNAKSAFLANVSHELRTPLNAIDGFINLLAKNPSLDSKQTLYVQTIKKSSAHLLALINDVLDFSKIEAGKLILDTHPFDLHETVHEVADMLSPTALEKGLRMSVLFYQDVPSEIVGDRLRVKQILTNLVGNALKFTETGSVNLKITLDEDGNSLQISVSDTGRGVDSDMQQLLFQSFEQGDVSVTRRYGGTGLGLVICRQLTELMGGQIGFLDNNEANIDRYGSTFWFSLPIKDPKPKKEPLLPNLSLLSWINHPQSRTVLKANLAGTATTLTEAKSLAELLEILTSTHSYDWVLVDSFGQQGDVTALLRQVRLHYHGKLLVFGYEVGLDGAVLESYGANALYEPLDGRQLHALLGEQQNHSPTSSTTWQGVRVLAVDDHLPNLLVLEALLGEFDIDVVQANSGFEAIDIMNRHYDNQHDNHRIDLIFMDISMPVMSGIATASAIRKIESTHTKQQIPIIALSAHGYWDTMDTLHKAGINDYATKPIAHHELVQLLQKWLPNTAPSTTPTLPNVSQGTLADTPMPATLTIIDYQDGLARAGNKDDLAKKLLSMFLESLPDERQALESAWQTQNLTALSDVAHRLLGATRYTGVPALRTCLEAFYTLCLKLSQTTLPTTWQDELQTPYRAVLEAIDALMANQCGYHDD